MWKLIKRIWIPCTIWWILLVLQWLFLYNATESWMMLWILMLVPYRLMLWTGPFVLSGIVWLFGSIKRRWSIDQVLVAHFIVLVLNLFPYYLTYLMVGGYM